MHKKFYWFGISASLIYFIAIILSGFLVPNYSHINQVICEVVPLLNGFKKYTIITFFILYCVFLFIFSINIYKKYNRQSISFKLMSLCMIIISINGLLMVAFPMDAIGKPMTLSWMLHIAFTTLSTPLTVIICFLGNWTFKNKMRIYSIISGIIISIFGLLSAIYILDLRAGMGLFERIAVSTYLLWLFVFSIYIKNKLPS